MTDAVWSYWVARDEVPGEGLHVEITADPATRAKLATTAGLRDLSRLDASFDIARKGREGLHVLGEVFAVIGQNCVVTLEPVEITIQESIDVIFASDAALLRRADSKVSFTEREAEPPEALVGGGLDLGAIATEHFLVGIDPYPRKEGAVFETASAGEAAGSPFAALAALNKPPKDAND